MIQKMFKLSIEQKYLKYITSNSMNLIGMKESIFYLELQIVAADD